MIANPFKYRTCQISWQNHPTRLRSYRKDHITRAFKRGHFYEDDFLDMIAKKYASSGTFVDVGAFVGNHSVFFAKHCLADQVVAFEPFPETFQLLRHNIKLNGLASKIKAVNKGIGDQTSTLTMSIVSEGNRGMNRIDVGGKTRVDVTTLDSELANHTMPISFLKIDAEGFGANVIRGAKQILTEHKPVVAVELEPDVTVQPSPSDNIEQLLGELGYVAKSCHNATPTWIFEHHSKAA
jgi:FkbM family methyltransferase